MKRRFLFGLVMLLLLGAVGAGATWGVRHFLAVISEEPSKTVPMAKVRKSRVTIEVTARGELQGGSSEALITPSTGVNEVPIISLRSTGDKVEAGDVVVEFDTTQQEYNLREAQADLEEAQQKVLQAEADSQATLEEARFATVSTALDVKLAELDLRKNPTLPANEARQNEIRVQVARNKQAQAERDYKNKVASSTAGITIQKAQESKAKLMADNARRNIDNMVLKAKSSGYVYLQSNTNGTSLTYAGLVFPDYQVGDTARAGQGIALIPNMSSWEVSTSIPEVDRGYLKPGLKVSVRPAAMPGRELKGHVSVLGGTTGSAWNRKFDCRIALDQIDPELRPGMTANLTITVESLEDVLWVPSQALFESDGRAFVYVNNGQSFIQQDVKLIRRSESQAVITGLDEGQEVALSRPDQPDQSKTPESGGALKALTK